MNPTTGVTQDRELVFLRLDQSFPQFLLDLFHRPPLWALIPLLVLLGLTALLVSVRIVRRSAVRNRPVESDQRRPSDPTGDLLWWATAFSVVALVLWALVVLFVNDTFGGAGSLEVTSANRSTNTALWFGFTGLVLLLGTAVNVASYFKDSRGVKWYWATKLAILREVVYVVLCVVFLLPAVQTYERVEKRSRVVVLLDVSPSITKVSDEIGTVAGKKLKTRITTVIETLTDEKVALVKNLLEKNPVVVYRFGTRLDEEPQVFNKDDAAWAAGEWEAFTSYDFKPFLLRGLSSEGQEAVKNSRAWGETAAGTPEWAATWLARPEDESVPGGMPDADREKLRDNRAKLEKRVEVARSIALGTNVPDTLTALVNREAPNMVQGVIVFSDGRSNLGSESGYLELKQRAAREKIPIFTVAVGEDRQTVSIILTDVQAPEQAPPDEPFKIVVEADGVNLANKELEVFLDLWLPGRDMKVDPADHTLNGKLTFQPGDPPHGQFEFVLDPSKLPDKLTEDAKDAAIKKRVLKEGAWAARARIPKDKGEAFADAEHVRDREKIQVIKKPLRVLLIASGPSREYQSLKTMLVREMQDNRAELCILLQNEAGEKGTAVQDIPAERLLNRFPTRLDTSGKAADPKERFYNLNEYDLIVAFDPDWSEVSAEQAGNLERWVQEQGGGFIFVADRIHTFELVRFGTESNSRLSPIMNILPVVPEDIIALRAAGTPRTARRLYLTPLPGSELLKLEEAGDDPVAGWERFFTDREKYVPNADLRVELQPRRGFFSTYPIKENTPKPGARILAELGTLDQDGAAVRRPWLVTNNPAAGWRTAFMGSGEMFKMFAYDPPTGKEYFQRFWVKMMKYMAGKRNAKASRGRVLLSKEYTTGAPVRVQARILDPGSRPYPEGAVDPKFRIIRMSSTGEREKELGPFTMAAKKGPSGFDGYYQGQAAPDPREMPPGDKRYRVVIDVPDSPGETIEGEFMLRRSDPEMDNTRPDLDALLRMASPLDGEFAARITKAESKERLLKELPKESGVTKLTFKLSERELLALIPDCIDVKFTSETNRGKADDLWDKGFTWPESLTPWFAHYPQRISYVLLAVVLLLCWEWATRKLLRLA